MKVKELIQKLKSENKEAEVFIFEKGEPNSCKLNELVLISWDNHQSLELLFPRSALSKQTISRFVK